LGGGVDGCGAMRCTQHCSRRVEDEKGIDEIYILAIELQLLTEKKV
jgi:hypothetical protein